MTRNSAATGSRLSMLIRENTGRRERGGFRDAVSKVLGLPVTHDSFLDLVSTDDVLAQFESSFAKATDGIVVAFRKQYAAVEEKDVLALLCCFSGGVNDVFALLISKRAEYYGALRLKLKPTIEAARQMLALDGDSLILISEDRTQGLLFDWRPDDPTETYELTIWGDVWARVAVECSLPVGL